MVVKENDSGEVELRWYGALVRWGKMKMRLSDKKSGKIDITFFIAVDSGNRVVQGGWTAAVVWIQCFNFGLRVEVTGWSVTGRWSGDNNFLLALWKGSTTRRDDVGRRRGGTREWKRGDNASWADANLTGPKNKENSYSRFNCYKWLVKI
jgi:hypothetical protein